MQTPVFKALNTDAVRRFVGTAPARIYAFGAAPQNALRPYIVHQMIAVTPFARLHGAPKSDRHLVQVDVYADDPQQASQLAAAVRDALDAAGVPNNLTLQHREAETGLYRYAFDAHFILPR